MTRYANHHIVAAEFLAGALLIISGGRDLEVRGCDFYTSSHSTEADGEHQAVAAGGR
jgi:hypothetical protein